MTQDNHTYQAMFLLDNQEVRQNGFNAVRERVKTTLEKHGLSAKVLRLWGERKLAYAIGQRRRATYLLGWIEGSGEAVNQAKADFYLVGPVFRCTFLREDTIPDEELAFGIEEIEDSAVVIPDDVEEIVEEPASDDSDDDSSDDDSGDSDDDSDDSDDEEDE